MPIIIPRTCIFQEASSVVSAPLVGALAAAGLAPSVWQQSSFTPDRWASAAGGGTGLSSGSPYLISDFFSEAASNSSVRKLGLLDGTYTGSSSMINPADTLAGTS